MFETLTTDFTNSLAYLAYNVLQTLEEEVIGKAVVNTQHTELEEFLTRISLLLKNDTEKLRNIQHSFKQNKLLVIKKVLGYVLSPTIYDILNPNQQTEWFQNLRWIQFEKNPEISKDREIYQAFWELFDQEYPEQDCAVLINEIITLIKLYHSLNNTLEAIDLDDQKDNLKIRFQELLQMSLEKLEKNSNTNDA